jgi:predicted outer membrane protein
MIRKIMMCLIILLFVAATAMAQDADKGKGKVKDKDKASDAKELSGMSIVGNDEAPKSLYIVPWKSSEIGVETSLNAMLNEGDMPVDRDVFKRQLEFYNVSKEK